MGIHVYIRAALTTDEASRLDRAIERGLKTRAWLVGQIGASSRDEAEALRKKYEREIKYLHDWRTADADAVDAAIADKY